MIDIEEQQKYIRDKLAFLSSKVERDNSQNLYDINKICESVFLHLLNCSYDYQLEDANKILYSDFPAIDLIDYKNKLVIQVTSTKTTQKIYNSITKLQGLNDISTYKLKMCYIAGKPNFSKDELKNIEKRGLTREDLLSIDDILTIALSDNAKRKVIYNTLLQRIDSKAFNLDIESYFEKFEAQLNKETTNKFYAYNNEFQSFIDSDANVLEIFAIGGNGKSHLVKYFATLQSDYTPVLFTKLDNVDADLKSLDITQRYLFIYDDIDRFLENGINSIFSFLISSNSKIIISYRAASKPLVDERILKFDSLKSKELYITWNKDEIKDLILLLRPDSTEYQIGVLDAQFNSNPYLITQAIKGNVDKIKNFSKKTFIDSIVALEKFHLKKVEVEELLFKIALLSPCSRSLISKEEKSYVNELIKVGVLRELNNKIRFNPDMLGDLYLAKFVKENEHRYKEIVVNYIEEHLELIITNLSYIFVFENSSSLESFFKDIINDWLKNQDFRSSNLKILYRIVNYAPFEAFIYLKHVTDTLIPKENKHQKLGVIGELVSKISYKGDFNDSNEHVNLGSIIPIINILINKLKNEKELGRLKIKDIVKFLVSPKVLSLPIPYYANHKLNVVFNDMLIPYESKNNNAIIEALDVMQEWLNNESIDSKKLNILKNALENLLKGTIQYFHSEENVETEFNISKENISKVLDKAKKIILIMLNSFDINLKCMAIDIIYHIGSNLSEESSNTQYYRNVIIEIFEILKEQITLISDFKFLSKLDDVLLNIITYRKYKNEALKLLIKIPRTEIFTFNQLLIGKTCIVYNLEKFIEEYYQQENIKDWIFDKYYNKKHLAISENEKNFFNSLIEVYKNVEEFVGFINSLHFIEYKVNPIKLIQLLEYWNKIEPKLFYHLYENGISQINDNNAKAIIENFLLSIGIFNLDINSIDETSDLKDLKRYVDISFKSKNISLYKKLFEIFKIQSKENIQWFEDTSFMHIYTIIKDDITMFNIYRIYIHELLNLIIEHRFTPSIYLIFILEILKENNLNFELLKNKIKKILYIPYEGEMEEIRFNNEHDLKILFNLLNYSLDDIFARIYWKLYFKRMFNLYSEEHDILECKLIKDYINSYEDYKKFILLVFDYYKNFAITFKNEESSKEYKIDINYFFTGLKNEYFTKYIKELIESNNKYELLVLLNIIPIKSNYKELIVEVLNYLENELSSEEVITILTKNMYSKKDYEEFLNGRTLSNGIVSPFEIVNEEVNNYFRILTYISAHLLNLMIISDINIIIEELEDTIKMIEEIKLEHIILK